MKNLPERIYLDLGFTPDADTDFNDLTQVTWSKDNATGEGIEYVRKDIEEAEKMAKEFYEWVFIESEYIPSGRNNFIGEDGSEHTFDELFTEFNSRKAQK